MTDAKDAADEKMAQQGEQKTFCRHVDVSSRKQGGSGGSVLAHMTDAKDAADEEMAQQGEQKHPATLLLFYNVKWPLTWHFLLFLKFVPR